jgi:hypothetical protein
MGAVKKGAKSIEKGVKKQFFGGAEKDAAAAKVAAAEKAGDKIDERFQENKELLTPFAEGGAAAFKRQQAISGALGPEAQAEAFKQFQESPAVKFQREQGLAGIESQAAASRNLGGGNRLKAISQFNQQLAQQQIDRQFNQLGAITGVGLSATNSITGSGSNAALGQADAFGQAGAAKAAGILGKKAAIKETIEDITQAFGASSGGSAAPGTGAQISQVGGGQDFAGFA